MNIMKMENNKLIILGAGFSKIVNKNNVTQNDLLNNIVDNFNFLLKQWMKNQKIKNLLELNNFDVNEILSIFHFLFF